MEDLAVDLRTPRLASSTEARSAGQPFGSSHWPGHTIPYELAANLSANAAMAFQDAMAHWSNATSIRCRPRVSSDTAFLPVARSNSRSTAGYGYTGARQTLQLADGVSLSTGPQKYTTISPAPTRAAARPAPAERGRRLPRAGRSSRAGARGNGLPLRG
ncbi:MAG: M12 family metallopeptidase [Planctomycetota bacterium]